LLCVLQKAVSFCAALVAQAAGSCSPNTFTDQAVFAAPVWVMRLLWPPPLLPVTHVVLKWLLPAAWPKPLPGMVQMPASSNNLHTSHYIQQSTAQQGWFNASKRQRGL
jgi:hypothetical protein